MCIWEGDPYKFHGPTSTFTYTPSRWHWIAGVVSMRWMFLFERYMKTLKIYVRKKALLEGCITEGYVLNEAFFFLCEFLGKDFKDEPHFWDDEWAFDIINGEKTQSNGVQVEISK